MIADQATPATLIAHMIVTISEISLHASGSLRIDIGKPLEFFVRVSRHLPLSSSDPPGFPISALLFLGQRSDGIALPLGKCHAGRLPLFSRCSLRVSGTLWDAFASAGLLASCSPFNRSLSLRKSPWLIAQNPEPSNSPSISLLMPGCGLNHFTSRWDLRRKPKPSRPFSTSSRPRIRSSPLRSSAWKRKSITPFTFSNPSHEKRTDLCPQVHRPRRPRLGIS